MKFTKENFENEVLKSDKLVVVDFFATWCGPCRMLTPVIEEVEKKMPNVKFGKLDIDESEELAIKYHVQAVPTLIFFRDGDEVGRVLGYRDEDGLISEIEEYI